MTTSPTALMYTVLLGTLCSSMLPVRSAGADTSVNSVTVAGDFQDEQGCSEDWQPACDKTFLTFDEEDDVWQATFTVPQGNWQFKAALNGSWDLNYGAGGIVNGANVTLNVPSQSTIKFYFDNKSGWITSSASNTIVTAAGDFQQQLGCQSNWQPGCLRSWLQDLDGDGIYQFSTTALAAGTYQVKAAVNESWSENYGENGEANGPNIVFEVLEDGNEVFFAFDSASKAMTVSSDGFPSGNINQARAYWLSSHVFAWDIPLVDGQDYALHYDKNAQLKPGVKGIEGGETVAITPAGILSGTLADKYPHLTGYPLFSLPASENRHQAMLRSQLALSVSNDDQLVDASGLQIAGVLDDLYYYEGELGPVYQGDTIQLSLWAPTARDVKLLLFSTSDAQTPVETLAMDYQQGVWRLSIPEAQWDRAYYLFDVGVYAPSVNAIVNNKVTDPYSLSLSTNSKKSQLVNLSDADLQPENWTTYIKPSVDAPEDIAIYELHVRDFSIHDNSVQPDFRGTYKAFTDHDSLGMNHLRSLVTSGMTHLHLLPVFDISSVNEDKSSQVKPGDLSRFPPDSSEQQTIITETQQDDGFNWGYDPLHFTVPEGSYSTNPNGVTRIIEFREMVMALNRLGLQVVMDVVYNHTTAAGQNNNSVLDKIVPGYYHRLSKTGAIETSTCCQNTASEHKMMEKLMIDSLVTWTRQFKVDGYRFDIMGHHTKQNIVKAEQAIRKLTREQDGIDGQSIYLYGEGWNFGEVINDTRFEQATQKNMRGTGIGSFNDRMRDAVRGGNPFGGYQAQGLGNGLYTSPNAIEQGDQLGELLRLSDLARIGLAGNLADYRFTNQFGVNVAAREIDYGGQEAGYTADPQEVISYVAAHDNETLFDAIQLKAPVSLSMSDRVRMQSLSSSFVTFAQGIPFYHAGQEFLRSKSLDRDSYNSGDWFNAIDFSFNTNNWGIGLPVAEKNEPAWPIMAPLLANPLLAPTKQHQMLALSLFKEQLMIRKSSPLFRLTNAEAVSTHVHFLNTGPSQVPGIIAMALQDPDGKVHKKLTSALVVFNTGASAISYRHPDLTGKHLVLHPVLQGSADMRLRSAISNPTSGEAMVPAYSTAVFNQYRPVDQQLLLMVADVEALATSNAVPTFVSRLITARLKLALSLFRSGGVPSLRRALPNVERSLAFLHRAGHLPLAIKDRLMRELSDVDETLTFSTARQITSSSL